MERRTKKALLIATALIMVIAAASLIHMLQNDGIYSLKVGCHSFKITVLNENQHIWDISIADDMSKNNIVQTEVNEYYLMEFRKYLYKTSKILFSLFFMIAFTVYVFIIFIFINHDKLLFKCNRYKKAFLIFIIAFNVFLLARFYIDYIELRHIDRLIECFYHKIVAS